MITTTISTIGNIINYKQGLEYGVQAPVFYRNLREQTEENVFSATSYRHIVLFLHKSRKISRNLRELTGECNLGILYSSSLSRILAEKSAARPVGGPGAGIAIIIAIAIINNSFHYYYYHYSNSYH